MVKKICTYIFLKRKKLHLPINQKLYLELTQEYSKGIAMMIICKDRVYQAKDMFLKCGIFYFCDKFEIYNLNILVPSD